VNSNPACDFRVVPSYRKYGFEASVVGPFREGRRLHKRVVRVVNDARQLHLQNSVEMLNGAIDIKWESPFFHRHSSFA
jgi:hypothetical protein